MIEAIKTALDFHAWVGFFIGAVGMFFLKDMFVAWIESINKKNS